MHFLTCLVEHTRLEPWATMWEVPIPRPPSCEETKPHRQLCVLAGSSSLWVLPVQVPNMWVKLSYSLRICWFSPNDLSQYQRDTELPNWALLEFLTHIFCENNKMAIVSTTKFWRCRVHSNSNQNSVIIIPLNVICFSAHFKNMFIEV